MKFLKKKKSIVIPFIIGVILASSIAVYAYNYNANDIKYIKANGTEISVENALNELYKKEKYIRIDKEYLETGSIFGNVQITDNNKNNTIGLSITGHNTNKPVTPVPVLENRWEKQIDLTNVSLLTFYAKKGANHGGVYIGIDDNNTILTVHYGVFGDNWLGYYVDLSEYTGMHKIIFGGGYPDNTGYTSSNTQYCDIRLY